MKRTVPQRYCINYRKLDKIQQAIRNYNKLAGWKGIPVHNDTSNCENCDKYPSLMGMKICFKLPLFYRLLRFISGIKYYRIHISISKKDINQ